MTERLLITISGPPAVGTSSLAQALSERIDAEVISGGDIFRIMADERSISISELSQVAESDPSIDKELDDRIRQIIEDHSNGEYTDGNLIVDSRLSAWHAEDVADLKICLKAPLSTRASRIQDRVEDEDELKERHESEKKRYMDYYGIDIEDISIYDLVIDTEYFTPSATQDIAYTAIENL